MPVFLRRAFFFSRGDTMSLGHPKRLLEHGEGRVVLPLARQCVRHVREPRRLCMHRERLASHCLREGPQACERSPRKTRSMLCRKRLHRDGIWRVWQSENRSDRTYPQRARLHESEGIVDHPINKESLRQPSHDRHRTNCYRAESHFHNPHCERRLLVCRRRHSHHGRLDCDQHAGRGDQRQHVCGICGREIEEGAGTACSHARENRAGFLQAPHSGEEKRQLEHRQLQGR
mmetsp:Transcript_30105/g.75598  ORF Transcript_30105/g.75598 Transcript_30105/m.75598 type:complete len:231 (-) Transcript_30105:642-1334(-)